jgi:S-adenosylmethionine-diacylglycerol 3-amino-3-carboxypropyl transferase
MRRLSRTIAERARFDIIRYANSWEDADVLCDALRPAPGKRMLAIASAGDNAFALLAGGAEVVAADLSAAQLALVELKRAAIRQLDDDTLLAFLGAPPSRRLGGERLAPPGRRDAARPAGADAGVPRLSIYESLHLPRHVRAYWDANRAAIETGVIHAGRFENYFRIFRKWVLPLVHSKRDVEKLLAEKTREERERFYREEWNTWRWRAMFRVFFSRFVMGRTGRDPEFFRYVEGSVAERIFKRAEYAMTALAPHANPYLTFIFTGNYRGILPRYLRDIDAVRRNLDKLTLVQSSIEEAAIGRFDGYYLSDIFEYIDPKITQSIFERLLSAANPGARFAYWNLLVPRSGLGAPLKEEADALFARDLAFFYSAFVLEEAR